MPSRTYSIRGALSGSGLQHEKIQLAWYDNKYLYRIRDFKVYSTLPLRAATVTGMLSKGKDDALDPEYLQLEEQNTLAWSSQTKVVNMTTPVIPGVAEEMSSYRDAFIDADINFGYDLWIHTNSSSTGVDVSYYILIEKFKVPGRGRLVNDLEQYQLNVAGD